MAYDDIFGITDLREGPKNALSVSLDVDATTEDAGHEDGIVNLLHTPWDEAEEGAERGELHHSHIRLNRERVRALHEWSQAFLNGDCPGQRVIRDERFDRLVAAPGSDAPLDEFGGDTVVLFHAFSVEAPERYHIPLSNDTVETLANWLEQFLNEDDLGERWRRDIDRNKEKKGIE